MRSFSVVVVGTPVPQGSKSARVIGKRAVMFDANKHLRAWRKKMEKEFSLSFSDDPLDGPLSLCVDFYFNPPKARKGERWHSVKPDLDKLVRAVCDSLESSNVIKNDSRIFKVEASKIYTDSKERVEVGVYEHES